MPYSVAKAPQCKSQHNDSDEDDDDFQPVITTGNTTDVRCKTICHQHIGSEQRCCNELCDGYRWLKDTLPISNQKLSNSVS